MVGINLDLGNIVKLFSKGNIVKVYDKMFRLAERFANHEAENYKIELKNKIKIAELAGKKFDKDFPIETVHSIWKFRNERFDYHMNEMKDLLIKANKQK